MKIKEFEKLQPGAEVMHSETSRRGVVVRTSAQSAAVLVNFDNSDKEWVEYYKLEKL